MKRWFIGAACIGAMLVSGERILNNMGDSDVSRLPETHDSQLEKELTQKEHLQVDVVQEEALDALHHYDKQGEPLSESESLAIETQKKIGSVEHYLQDNSIYTDQKRYEAKDLVKKGITYLQGHSEEEAWSLFSHDKSFVRGEIYLFVFNNEGICLAHGQEDHLIWENLYELRDSYGVPFVKNIIKKANEGPGWVSYQWRGAVKISYVQTVLKNGKTYVVGAGYYPHSRKNKVTNLVKEAINLFEGAQEEKKTFNEIFGLISYPQGRFVFGDLYIFVIDFHGKVVAHGGNQELIGINQWNYKDDNDVPVYQNLIEILKTGENGTWFDDVMFGITKKNYAEKIKGPDNTMYAVISGYYPDVTQDMVVDLVRKAYRFMKIHGKSESAQAFMDKNGKFMYAGLYLFIYDTEGNVISDGSSSANVGTNNLEKQDEEGTFFIKDIIKKGEQGGGWVSYFWKGALKYTYVEAINLGLETFIIASGLYPMSKNETSMLLAKNGAEFLETHSFEHACREFVTIPGRFIIGDLSLFLFDEKGICYAFGDDRSIIWKNCIEKIDDDGRPYVKLFIDTARAGAGRVSFTINNTKNQAYVIPIEKDGQIYVIGSYYSL